MARMRPSRAPRRGACFSINSKQTKITIVLSPTPRKFTLKMSRLSKNWCLTVYPDKEADPGLSFDQNRDQYLIVGKEVCPDTGRQHYQVFYQSKKKVRLTGIKKIWQVMVMW